MFHEFGHLLLGHLDIGSGHFVEFQADLFAAIALGALVQKQGNSFSLSMMVAGISLVFTLLKILEKYYAIDSDTHPSATDRINELIDSYNNSDMQGVYRDYLRDFAVAFNPTLKRWWQFEINCEE
jgi:hypothetical protein